MIVLGWPQLIWLAILLLSVGVDCARHGKPKKPGTHNGVVSVCGGLIAFGLLYWGGFFT